MFFRVLSVLLPVVALAGSAQAQGQAQDRRPPASAGEVRLSYAPVVQRATPAVVNVYAGRAVQSRNPLMEDPFFRRFFGPGFGAPQTQRALGSGVIVDPS